MIKNLLDIWMKIKKQFLHNKRPIYYILSHYNYIRERYSINVFQNLKLKICIVRFII